MHSTGVKKCGYNDIPGNCPAYGKDCYSIGGKGHLTSLCRRAQKQCPREQCYPQNIRGWSSSRSMQNFHSSRSHQRHKGPLQKKPHQVTSHSRDHYNPRHVQRSPSRQRNSTSHYKTMYSKNSIDIDSINTPQTPK